MSLFERVKAVLTGERMPPVVIRAIARAAVAIIGFRMRLDDRQQALRKPRAQSPSRMLYLVDGYHGGVVFWDWLGIRGGGLWRLYNWPLCLKPSIERAVRDERFRVVLDLDAYTYEWMQTKDLGALSLLRRGLDAGRVELVNGTYAQPFARAESGESFLRQLEHGTEAIRSALGGAVTTFYSQEPSYFPQLPQILIAFGYKNAVFRTQWAPFGTDPGHDADMILWRAPDGSGIPTVPRYRFQNYERQLKEHPGLAAGSLSMGDIPDWSPESLAPFGKKARRRGISHPLVADLKDPNIPEAPLPRAVEIAGMENVRFLTIKEYARLVAPAAEAFSYNLDDIPCTLPWGLQAEEVPRIVTKAETALNVGERLDAVAQFFGNHSQEVRLKEAWKSFCLAQHHDLYVCGPWRSRAHGAPMSDVAKNYAASARDTADAVVKEAISKLSAQPAGDVIVFNPAGHKRFDYIEVSVPRDALPSPSRPPALTDGLFEYPCQVVQDGEKVRLGALVHAPSLGIVHLKLIPASNPTGKDRFREANKRVALRLSVSPEGYINLIDGEGKVVVEGPFLTCNREGNAYDSRTSACRAGWIADGPVYRRLEVEGSVAGVPFIQTLTEYGRIGRIDAKVRVDFGADGAYLGPQIEDDKPGRACSVQDEKKLCLAFTSSHRRIWCASPFWISENKGERISSASWVGLEGDGDRGFALINRGTRGYHFERATGTIRNVLAWGPKEWIYASEDSITRGRSQYTALKGEATLSYAISPYASRGDAEISAMEVAMPLLAIWREGGREGERGELPPPWSALSVKPASVMVTAFLVRNGSLYARLWNTSEDESAARIVTADGGRIYSAPLGLDGNGEELADGRLQLPPWGLRAVKIGEK